VLKKIFSVAFSVNGLPITESPAKSLALQYIWESNC
jgi:hypothetical protein